MHISQPARSYRLQRLHLSSRGCCSSLHPMPAVLPAASRSASAPDSFRPRCAPHLHDVVRRLLSIALAQAEAVKVVLQCIGLALQPASRQLMPVGVMAAARWRALFDLRITSCRLVPL